MKLAIHAAFCSIGAVVPPLILGGPNDALLVFINFLVVGIACLTFNWAMS